jgi:histidyl-tRNA synthetase
MAKFQAPKGTHDVYPGAQKWWENTRLWNHVEKTFRELTALYGYEEIKTPVFEATGLFTRAVGDGTDIVSKEMYTFESKGKDSLTLRPEGTAPVVRAYVEDGIYAEGGVAKLFYIGPIFRYERPQEGRFRQHTQCGVEALGSQDPRLDAEIVHLALSIYKKLGLKRLVTKVNSVGCPECRPAYREKLLDFARPFYSEMSADNQRRFNENPLRMLDSKDPHDNELFKNAPRLIDSICDDCAQHFEAFKTNLSSLGAEFELDPRLVRGFDYYTKTAFEIQSPDLGAQSTLCGGGRYDGLIEHLGGPKTPGIGFGMGVERILIALQKLELCPDAAGGPEVFLVTLGDNASQAALGILQKLRDAGIPCDTDFAGRSMKAQMRAANKSGAPFALIVGDSELESGQLQLKDLRASTQEQLSIDQVIEKIVGSKN